MPLINKQTVVDPQWKTLFEVTFNDFEGSDILPEFVRSVNHREITFNQNIVNKRLQPMFSFNEISKIYVKMNDVAGNVTCKMVMSGVTLKLKNLDVFDLDYGNQDILQPVTFNISYENITINGDPV